MTIHDYSTGRTPKEGDPTWDTKTLQEEFSVHGFGAPFVFVTRKSDGVRGVMEFAHSPRIYFDFVPDAS